MSYIPQFDFPLSKQVLDSVNSEPRWLGFDVVDAEGCYLTEHAPLGVQQVWLTPEQLSWLVQEGGPAVLRAIAEAAADV